MPAIAIPPIPHSTAPRLPMPTMATPTTYGKSGNESGNKIGNTGNAAHLLTHAYPAPTGTPTPGKIRVHATPLHTGNISGKNSGNNIGKSGNISGNLARMRNPCPTPPLPRTVEGQGWRPPAPATLPATKFATKYCLIPVRAGGLCGA